MLGVPIRSFKLVNGHGLPCILSKTTQNLLTQSIMAGKADNVDTKLKQVYRIVDHWKTNESGDLLAKHSILKICHFHLLEEGQV